MKEEQKPQDIHEEIWKYFRAFVYDADNEAFLTFIRAFEWGMQEAGANSLRRILQQRLQTLRYARDADHANTVYMHMFFSVFERLTHTGLKRLTVEDRERLLAQPSFDARAQSLFEIVHDLLDTLEERMAAVEERVGTIEGHMANVDVVQGLHTEQLATLQGELGQVMQEQNLQATLLYGEYVPPSLDIPPLVEHLSRRENTVKDFHRQVLAHTWVALHGQLSCGKTQLAALLVEETKKPCLWVRLNDARPCEENRRRLDAACLAQVKIQAQGNLYRWYKQVVESIGSEGFLILDGLPRLQGNELLSEALLSMLKACKATGISMISISPHPLLERIRAACRKNDLFTMVCPPFTHQEAADILRTYGAPGELLTKEQAMALNRQARKHPRLLQAMGHYLQQRDWRFDNKTYEALFTNQHAPDLIEETLSGVLDTVEEEDSRQLLYRLNVIIGSFTQVEVLDLAHVAPLIERPRERLQKLMGLWIGHDSHERYIISPLIQMVGSDDVAPQTYKGCNHVLAERLLTQKLVNIWDVNTILIHLLQAEQYDRAGWLLIRVLVDFLQQNDTAYDGDILSNWSGTPLPQQMNLGIRLYLRALQCAARRKRRLSTTYIERDLATLTKQADSNDSWALLGALIVVPDVVPDIQTVLLRVLRSLPKVLLPNGEPLGLSEELYLEELIWLIAMNISTIADLDTWMQTVSELTDEQRQFAFADEAAEQGSLVVAEVLWMREAQKPQARQQWSTIQRAVEKLSAWAASFHLDLLWACAFRARIIIAAEYCSNLQHAVALAEEVVHQSSDDPRISFLIEECLGRQYLYTQQYLEAAVWLGYACEEKTEAFPLIRIPALLAASRASGRSSAEVAVAYAEQAVSLGKTTNIFPEMELLKAEGELALARWLAGDIAGTFEAWDSAGQRLLACKSEDDAWKGLFVLYGHTSGYFTAMASTGEPPQETSDGSPYILPERGIFTSEHQQRAAYYGRVPDCYLMTQLALFAQVVGQEQRMLAWCEQGMRQARESQQPLAWVTLCELEIPSLIQKGEMRTVLEYALDIGAIGTAGMKQGTRVKDILKSELVVTEILGGKPSETWNLVEARAARMGLVPIIFWIAIRTFTNRSEAETMAHELAQHCRIIGETASDKTLWIEGASLIERLFSGQLSWREINEQANRFSLEKHTLLRLIGYLGATIQGGMPLVEAWFAHRSILEKLGYDQTTFVEGTYQHIILPFFTMYWTTAFQQQRFRFTSPRLVEQDLHNIQAVPLRKRARTLLDVIASGLGITIIAPQMHTEE